VTASLIDSDGADRSASATGWTWRSTTSAVQATGAANVGTCAASMGATRRAVGGQRPGHGAGRQHADRAFPVSVFPTSVSSYRLVLSQFGSQINALNVLNGYPQTYLRGGA
jgi:hypothetical protein